MKFKFTINTNRKGFFDITTEVKAAVSESGVNEGICVIFSPHTTASLVVGDNSEENNHLLVSASETLIVSGGKPVLGKNQGIYFYEFAEHEKERKFYVKVIGG